MHEIAEGDVDHGETALVALRFFGLIDATERAQRERARFGRTRAGAEVFVDQQIEMRANLAIEIVLGGSATGIANESRQQLTQASHG